MKTSTTPEPVPTDRDKATLLKPLAQDINSTPRHTPSPHHKLKAMTLTELLVVLAILGILVLLAFPVVMPLFQKARSTEAKIQLKHICTLQKTYFLENAHYSKDPKEIGFQQAELDAQGGTAHYRIEIVEASNNAFLARAVAETDFDGDGQMNIWEIDQRCQPQEVVED